MDMLVSPDHQHSCHASWNPVVAGGEFLAATENEVQTEHHNSDDLQNRQQDNCKHCVFETINSQNSHQLVKCGMVAQ